MRCSSSIAVVTGEFVVPTVFLKGTGVSYHIYCCGEFMSCVVSDVVSWELLNAYITTTVLLCFSMECVVTDAYLWGTHELCHSSPHKLLSVCREPKMCW